MTRATRIALIGAATAAFASSPAAQLRGNGLDFSTNWHTNRSTGTGSIAFAGSALFGALAPAGTHPGPGDSIRRCFGIDETQGGRNQSAGVVETTWIALTQGFGPNNLPQFATVDFGLVSIVSYVDSDVNQDVCLNPFADAISGAGTDGQALNAAAVLGQIPGAGGLPFPTAFEVLFQWVGTGTLFQGAASPSTVGTFPDGNARLPYLVFEVQGPTNGGPGNEQYYLASTTESVGSSANAVGGITNGNEFFGYTLFGVTADQSFTQMGSRLTAFDGVAGTLSVATTALVDAQAKVEFLGRIATQTPALWASRDGSNDGGGGPDWVVSTSPTSVVDLRFLDCLGGAESTAQVGAHKGGITAGGGTPGPTSVFDPSILVNVGFFLWSTTSASSHPQDPHSWDDLGGALVPAVPGSVALGPQLTSREGPQTVPIVFDAVTSRLLGVPSLSFGSPMTPSDDLFEGTYFTTGGDVGNAAFEGAARPIVSGVSGLAGGPRPVFVAADPTLRGARVGVAAAGVQLRAGPNGVERVVTELANGLTLSLQ